MMLSDTEDSGRVGSYRSFFHCVCGTYERRAYNFVLFRFTNMKAKIKRKNVKKVGSQANGVHWYQTRLLVNTIK